MELVLNGSGDQFLQFCLENWRKLEYSRGISRNLGQSREISGNLEKSRENWGDLERSSRILGVSWGFVDRRSRGPWWASDPDPESERGPKKSLKNFFTEGIVPWTVMVLVSSRLPKKQESGRERCLERSNESNKKPVMKPVFELKVRKKAPLFFW